jgi:formamidopyrimidine-DNA glycosylase
MPERPDLEYLVGALRGALVGRRVEAAALLRPVVLRMLLPGKLPELLPGRLVLGVRRRGHFVDLALDAGLALIVHPMLAGRFDLVDAAAKTRKDVALHVDLSAAPDGGAPVRLRYRDEKDMGKVYLLAREGEAAVPGLLPTGVDVLGPDFTPAAFRALARARRDQAKVFLMDKAALDSFGNAYADEALFAAGVHPKAWVGRLPDAALDRLHGAMVAVLRDARDEIARRAPPLDEKLRDFLSVRLRKGAPCPRCGAPVRVCGVRGHDACFCAVCQVDERGAGVVDWRGAGG